MTSRDDRPGRATDDPAATATTGVDGVPSSLLDAARLGAEALGPAALDAAPDGTAVTSPEPGRGPADDATDALPAGPFRPAVARGVTIGRYLLVDQLGKGGMGVVYKAYDPELDRVVAIKLVASRHSLSGATPKERLLREAQALARLSHPGVVAIYDVGTFGDDVFLAMEFVAGPTLRQWLRAAPRPRRDIIAAFVAAGEGLDAAHRAGIIHRDFKPSNVLVGDDGRVRVLDFGLARASQPGPSTDGGATPRPATLTRGALVETGELDEDSEHDRLSEPLTRAGVVMGTPGYMAPEQFHGGDVDARTDQFAFCAALWEALYGVRPFAGRTLREHEAEVSAGRLVAPPPSARVPRRLRRILTRGLATSPAARFPSMTALLVELRRDPLRIALVAIAGAGVVAGAVVTIAIATHRGPAPDPCAAAAISPVAWDAERRDLVRAAFTATAAPFAADSFRGMAVLLDDYVGAWRDLRREACQATHVRHEQSPELLDLRMACLDHRADAIAAYVDVLARADAALVERATSAVAALPDLADCSDARTLRDGAAAIEPRQRAAVAAGRRLLEPVRAQVLVQPALALGAAAVLAGHAGSTGAPAYIAEVASLNADAAFELDGYDFAEARLRIGLAAGAAGRADGLVADLWLDLVTLLYEGRAAYAEAHRWLPLAGGAIERLARPEGRRVRLANVESRLAFLEGDYRAAAAAAERALAGAEALPRAPITTSLALTNLGNALDSLGDRDRARDAYQRALAISERIFGPQHPAVGSDLNNLGTLEFAAGNLDQALANYQRAITIFEAAAPGSSDVASAANNVGTVLTLQQGAPGAALTELREVLRILEREGGEPQSILVSALTELGNASAAVGDDARALAALERAVTLTETVYTPGQAESATPMVSLGRFQVEHGAAQAARDVLTRAVTLLEATSAAASSEPDELPAARFALARALWTTGGDRPAARALAAAARAEWLRRGTRAAADVRAADRWLDAHR